MAVSASISGDKGISNNVTKEEASFCKYSCTNLRCSRGIGGRDKEEEAEEDVVPYNEAELDDVEYEDVVVSMPPMRPCRSARKEFSMDKIHRDPNFLPTPNNHPE